MKKDEIRKNMGRKRGELSLSFMKNSGESACGQLASLPAFQKARSVMTYMDYRGEMPTGSLLKLMEQTGKQLILPYTDPNFILIPYELSSLNMTRLSSMGICEPDPAICREADPQKIDLVVVPGLAFDLKGNRIGFGKACYDRFLPTLRPDAVKIGYAYDFQVMNELPAEPTDVSLNGIVTERRIILPAFQSRSAL